MSNLHNTTQLVAHSRKKGFQEELQSTRGALEVLVKNISLDTKNKPVVHNDKVKIDSAGGGAVQSDSSPLPTADADDREGWLFKKPAGDTSKFNYYIYGATGSSHQFKFKDVKGLHMCCSIDKWDNTASIPFMHVYSKATGVGDAGAFYHSKKDFAINMTKEKILVGEHITLYNGLKPELANKNRLISLDNVILHGECNDDEEILFIVVASDSGSLIHTQILMTEAGYNLDNEIKRSIKFVA